MIGAAVAAGASDDHVLGTVLSVVEGETLGAAAGASDDLVLGTVLSVVGG